MANEFQGESIIGLLLRAYRKAAEQEHGERYVFHNDKAADAYKRVADQLYDSIHSVVVAEAYVRQQEAHKRGVEEGRKELAKEMQPNGQ